jgi:RNA polymerase sigma-70 factor (ECF subfamily)
VGDTDEELMLRAGSGDRTACQLLVERHLGTVVAFAERTLGGRDDAEDAAQDVFLRVWQSAPRYEAGAAKFTTWLYKVAMNVCLDRIRKHREATGDDVPELADSRPGPRAAAETAELAGRVRDAMTTLPETQRMALALCHYQGLRNIEAAQVLGVSIEALESLLSRARRTMREELKQLGPSLLGAS